MELKKGSKVRIKSWEEMEAEFGVDEQGDICGPNNTFVYNMAYLCGEVRTVGHLDEDGDFEFVGCAEKWLISPWMIAEVIS